MLGTFWRMAMQEAGPLNHERVATRNITSLNQFFNRCVIILSTTITSIIVAMLFLDSSNKTIFYWIRKRARSFQSESWHLDRNV